MKCSALSEADEGYSINVSRGATDFSRVINNTLQNQNTDLCYLNLTKITNNLQKV